MEQNEGTSDVRASRLDPIVGLVTLTGYIGMVSDFWATGSDVCVRCDMQVEPGYCAMLHDHSIPEGNCLGLLERDGVEQPADLTHNEQN